MPKYAVLLVILILTVSSLTLAKPACASTPKPSVPEFTVKFVDLSQNVTTIDPYTGASETQLNVNRTIEVIIKNQPLTTYCDISNNLTISFHYNMRMKGHFERGWTNISTSSEGFLAPSNSENTIFSYRSSEFSNAPEAFQIGNWWLQPAVGTDAQIDIQVEAVIGYFQAVVLPNGMPSRYAFNFIGEESGWSNTQTITIGENTTITTPSTSPSELLPTPTGTALPLQSPTTTQPSVIQTGGLFGLDWEKTALIVMAVLVAVLLVVVAVLLRRRNVK